ncbi:MAG: holo-acyl-carrier-protein synthase [Bacillota bacterium]|jgi:phosphopantetheine--protein transferase-like protein|nr:holo-acyl-carrier-protein synthase [Bacillota bacterium]
MIAGIGVDIITMSRLNQSLAFEDPFVCRTFTEGELAEARRSRDPARFLTSRFACKEAVFKCLKINSNGVRLKEIEIRTSEIGYPTVALRGNLKKYAEERGIVSIEVSLSHEDEYVAAFAAAQTDSQK